MARGILQDIVTVFSANSHINETPYVEVKVPDGYKVIGGGGWVEYVAKPLNEGGDAGCLLTGSYPTDDLKKWVVCKSKSNP
ncbi:hypothetical protein ACT8ZR_02540 [Neobacillus sp. M.A.Huq-85]